MFEWYEKDSGQRIESAVVDKIFHVTNGQPGLISWFGELLTEKFNPGLDKTIGMDSWKLVWLKARKKEPNNTVMNMVAKARNDRYRPFLLKLFTQPDIPFSFDNPIHNYLHLHGILDSKTGVLSTGEEDEICCFSSPFIQRRLYEALGHDMVGDGTPILSLDPLDELTDVFEGPSLDLPALLRRYKKYLVRLKDKGIDPWLDQPRKKTDLHLTEAVGHFHLYAWLRTAVGGLCVISPEFPTGNGKVDIHLRCADKQGIIEVKSFVSAHQVKTDREKAAWYAKSLGLDTVTLAIFVAVGDDAVLEKLSGEEMIDGVQVVVTAIGWA
ncbi:MAG: hypothetical protein GY866_18590 [Proteobacteria bacterium]|nr:hypothetical protein [Pseudomonadota bacterium]